MKSQIGQKVKWLKEETKRFFTKIGQMPRVESRDRHSDGDLKSKRRREKFKIYIYLPIVLYIHKYLPTYLVCKDLYPLEKKIAIKKAIDSSLPPTAFFWIVRALCSKNGIILLGNVSIIRGFGELSMQA